MPLRTDFHYRQPAAGDLPSGALLSRAGLIQPKLSVGPTDDAYEREADHVADSVMRKPAEEMAAPALTSVRTGAVQRACSACEAEEIQRKSAEGVPGGAFASSNVESGLQQTRGHGQSLDRGTRQFMESRFHTDFSRVNVHTGATAAQMNGDLGARAFTLGQDIYFNQGEYRPGSESGRHLIAHELAHVVQQTGRIQRKEPEGDPKPMPMSRAAFDRQMMDVYGVKTVMTGTEEIQKKWWGYKDDESISNWVSWDPGANSDLYKHIVESFAQFNTTFGGFPEVDRIIFMEMDRRKEGGKEVVYTDTGASFANREMVIYKATMTSPNRLPFARGNVEGKYPNEPGFAFVDGPANAPKIDFGNPEMTQKENILHELAHGLSTAASSEGYGGIKGAADANMIEGFGKTVGWL
ncbi:MAG: DUF4157 domain-containing protein, partial [Bacteroidota bacterium]